MTGTLAQPFVVDTAGERYLFFTYPNFQSCMRLDDPCALVCAKLSTALSSSYLCKRTIMYCSLRSRDRRSLKFRRCCYERATELEEALGLQFHRFLQRLRTGPTLRTKPIARDGNRGRRDGAASAATPSV